MFFLLLLESKTTGERKTLPSSVDGHAAEKGLKSHGTGWYYQPWAVKKSVWGGKNPEENKEIRVYLRRSLPGSCSSVTPSIAHRTHLCSNQPPCAPARLQTAVRMRASLIMCFCVFALQCLPSTLSLPVRRASRYKVAPVSERMLIKKKPFVSKSKQQ